MNNVAVICIVTFSLYVMRKPNEDELKPLYREEVVVEETIPEDIQEEKPQYIEMYVKATAYCPCEKCCGEYADGKTATMTDAYLPGVAVDKKKIKLGSKLFVPGYNEDMLVIADDVGGAIKGDKIDVRFPTHQEALEWGVKHITIRIYTND
jgi:3D (Asp-Asp-Asp) domain-containing protein